MLDPPAENPMGPGNPGAYPKFTKAVYDRAEKIRVSSEFQFSNPSRGWMNNPTPIPWFISPLQLINVHKAHAVKIRGKNITGQGQVIAILDSGFHLSHDEIRAKSGWVFPSVDKIVGDDHGTVVAAIAAGAKNGRGILGVAPDAKLHLAGWKTDGSNKFKADATRSAANRGAIVQNNSWGMTKEVRLDVERERFRKSGKESYADFVPSTWGGSASSWRNYFKALNDFQKTGVIVFANSNNENLGDVSAFAALPLLYPSLREAWIVVSNAKFDVNNGRITSVRLLSAPCGSAAAFCLTADGSQIVPTGTGNGYTNGTGTSYAAPQVSGLIALLAQAFPNLKPGELTTRLLATANTNFEQFRTSRKGQITFAPGITRWYSGLYGMGIPDIEAALKPVGALSMATGKTVAQAAAVSVYGGMPTSAPVIGKSLTNALHNRQMMFLDALGGDFYLKGKHIGLTGSATDSPAGNISQQIALQTQSFAYGLSSQSNSTVTMDTAAAKLFFSQSLSGAAGNRFSTAIRLDRTSLLHIAGYVADVPQANSAGVTLSRLREADGFSTELSVSAGHHQNRLFSSFASGPILGVDSTTTTTASFTATAKLGENWTVSGFAEMGVGAFSERPESLANFGPLLHASAGFSANRRNLALKGDRLSVYAGLRPRAVAGTAHLRLPSGRDREGRISYDRLAVDLAEGAGIPARVGLGYAAEIGRRTDFSFNVNYDFDATFRDTSEVSASVALRRRF